jgi:pilus assembly protein Flp/PilA
MIHLKYYSKRRETRSQPHYAKPKQRAVAAAANHSIMPHNIFPKREEGQGLVEYALILVLIAVVVIAVLLQLGPELRLAFGKVTAVLQGAGVITDSSGAITSVDASYSPGAKGNPAKLTVTVTVSQDTTVSVKGDGGLSDSQACSNSCTFEFTNPPANGSVIVTDTQGGEGVVAYW